jgi:hypothetical protein
MILTNERQGTGRGKTFRKAFIPDEAAGMMKPHIKSVQRSGTFFMSESE